MLKPARPLQSLLSLSRLPVRTYSQLGRHPEVNVQRVRIRKPWFSRKRIFTAALYGASAYATWEYVMPRLLGGEDENVVSEGLSPEWKEQHERIVRKREGLEEHERHGAEGEEGIQEEEEIEVIDLDEDEDAIFIPLTWARKMPQTLYKGSDPEWQEFVRFAQDRDRAQAVRREVVALVQKAVLGHPIFSRRLGLDIQMGKAWLDIDFPDGPPPEFERYGLQFGEGYIAYTSKPVTHRNYMRLNNALYPKAVALSAWMSLRMFYRIQVLRVKRALGLAPSNEQMIQQARMKLEELKAKHPEFAAQLQKERERRQQMRARQRESGQSSPPPPPTGLPPELGMPPPGTPNPHGGSRPLLPGIPGAANNTPGGNGQSTQPPSLPLPIADLTTMYLTFMATLQSTTKPSSGPPPRGSLVISGLVEMLGSNAMATVDVRAAYDPKERKFVGVNLAVRRFQERIQGPKGGL